MCLAEALLRVPDADTADRLIRDKIGRRDWGSHTNKSDSLFVNASTWALMLTGRIVKLDETAKWDFEGIFRKLVARSGEPVIRQAVTYAMRMLGGQFVLGRTIDEAMKEARALGEGRLSLLLRHAGRGGLHRRMTRSAMRNPIATRWRRLRRRIRTTASRSSSGRASR